MPSTYQIVLSESAVDDLDRLDTFLRPISADAADRVQDKFLEAARRLAAYPQSGRVWTWKPAGTNIRECFIPFGQRGYIMRYEVRESLILILRFHHGLEDRGESRF